MAIDKPPTGAYHLNISSETKKKKRRLVVGSDPQTLRVTCGEQHVARTSRQQGRVPFCEQFRGKCIKQICTGALRNMDCVHAFYLLVLSVKTELHG